MSGESSSRGVRPGQVLSGESSSPGLLRPTSCDQHAVDRFVERWYDAKLVDDAHVQREARRRLVRLCPSATHVEDCLGDLGGEGQSIWDLHDPEEDDPVRVAVARDGEIRTVFERGAHQR